jgi:hypothetical protein
MGIPKMKRWKLWTSALVVLVSAFALFLWLDHARPGVTLDNYYRLRSGMSEEEAGSIFGNEGFLLSEGRDGRFMKGWRGEGFLISASFPSKSDGLQFATFSQDLGPAMTLSDEEKGFLNRMWRKISR